MQHRSTQLATVTIESLCVYVRGEEGGAGGGEGVLSLELQARFFSLPCQREYPPRRRDSAGGRGGGQLLLKRQRTGLPSNRASLSRSSSAGAE